MTLTSLRMLTWGIVASTVTSAMMLASRHPTATDGPGVRFAARAAAQGPVVSLPSALHSSLGAIPATARHTGLEAVVPAAATR